MSPASRIIANTAFSYSRSVFAIALGMFSSRWVYLSLGQIDYGLFGVVGALTIFVTFLNGVMAGSTARFFALSIGKNDIHDTQRWFNVSLMVHLVMAIALISAGWPIGEWVIRRGLNIPLERLETSLICFRASLVGAFFNMIAVPFMGMFVAKQNIGELTLWSVVGTLAHFGLAFALLHVGGDSWMIYSIGTICISITLITTQAARAHARFCECVIRPQLGRDARRAKEILNFSGWTLFGALGGLLRNQGIAILLNRQFDPSLHPQVNASYSVANTVSSHTQTLSAALLGAFTPEIMRREGSGDRAAMLTQANNASKFGVWLVLLLAIPLVLEINTLLHLWLKSPPEMAGAMCSLMIATFVIDRITSGQMIAVAARGRIAAYQATLGGVLIFTLPLAWLLLKLGLGPVSVCYAYVVTITLCAAGRVWWANRLVGLDPGQWLRQVLWPCAIVCCAGVAVGLAVQALWQIPSLGRVLGTTGATLLSSTTLGWKLLLSHDQRQRILRRTGLMKHQNGSTEKSDIH